MGDVQRSRGLRWLALAGVPVILVAGIVAAIAIGDDGAASPAAQPASTETTLHGQLRPGTEPAVSTLPLSIPTTLATTAPVGTNRPVSTTAPGATVTTARPADASAGRLQVKFVDGSGVRLRGGGLVSLSGRDLTALHQLLARHPGVGIERLFQRPEADLAAEKAAAEARTGRPQPDLNLYYLLTLPDRARADALVVDLQRLSVVEQAYADPAAAPPPAPGP